MDYKRYKHVLVHIETKSLMDSMKLCKQESYDNIINRALVALKKQLSEK